MHKFDWEKCVRAFQEPVSIIAYGSDPRIIGRDAPLLLKMPAECAHLGLNEAINHPGCEISYHGTVIKVAKSWSNDHEE